MRLIRVDDINNLISKKAATVRESANIFEIAEAMIEDPKTRSVYVVDGKNRLKGIIPVIYFVKVIFHEYVPDEYLYFKVMKPIEFDMIQSLDTLNASDIMLNPIFVKSNESLKTAFQRMFSSELKEIPVVDEEMKVVGDLNILEMIEAWLEMNKE